MTDETATRPTCECGCGGTPRGAKSRYLPGHDARHASAQRKAAGSVGGDAARGSPDASVTELAPVKGRRTRKAGQQA